MAKLIDRILNESKNTVGYIEADSKESFLVGVEVGTSLALNHYALMLIERERDVEYYKAMYEQTLKDLQTISKIISKHGDS